MKKWLIMGTLVIFLILLINSTYASAPAPAPKQFVINPIEEKCGIYWAGDEFTYNELKEGWIIQKNTSTSFELKTPYGECTLENFDRNMRASTCCNKLGLNYVDFRNVSYSLNDVYENGSCGYVYSRIPSGDNCEKQGAMYRCLNPDCGKLQGPYKCKPSAPIEGSIIIDDATNKCTDLFTFYLYPSGGYAYGDQCFITEGDFVTFKGEYKTKLITTYGECENFSLYNEEVYYDCCDQFGFTFVGTDLDSNTINNEDEKKTSSFWQKFLNWFKGLFS